MKVLLVDDHEMFRDGISMLLTKAYPEVEILQAQDLAQALQQLRAHSDIEMILLDLHLQESSPHENIKSIKSRFPQIPITVISGEERPEFIRNILEYGVKGYVPKSIENNEFIAAIKQVLAGNNYLPAGIAAEIKRCEEQGTPSFDSLTDRQKQVLALMAQGISNQEIAERLNISGNTITVHVKNILKILNASNRTEAGFVAIKYGLV
ncbi:MAG: response regulator transcription factor [Kangiellaceae bacterium]|nr:response regulator transcription factor [Kangiellaceae bacterium]MCW8998662.1 response regulator transcription factor [Kangiellaceae bacterium]MCW9017874.1 response regulator transcription factor [Kangiellaceae bacterium]